MHDHRPPSKVLEWVGMKNNRTVVVVLGLLIIALCAGIFIRSQVLQGRTMPGPVPVTDFTSCLESGGDLDVTGTVCTAGTGKTFTKPGATLPATNTSPTPASTTTATSTAATSTPLASLALGTAYRFKLHETRSLPNRTTLTLTSIADSRCKPGVQCIWAGELSAEWSISTNGKIETFSLGTVRTGAVTKGGYTYTLGDTTPATATLTVTKAVIAPAKDGIVKGTVTVEPLCPVESIDHPCDVPPTTYTSRSVVVYAADKTTELESHSLGATGNFGFALKPGTYGLQIRPAGIGAGEIKSVTVVGGVTSNIHFDIDTGIR